MEVTLNSIAWNVSENRYVAGLYVKSYLSWGYEKLAGVTLTSWHEILRK